MPFPSKHLQDAEEVYLDVRPHWIRLFGPFLVGAVLLGGVIAAFVSWSSAPRWFGAMLACVLFLTVVFVMVRFVRWRSTNLVVTSYRVIYRTGVMHRVGREIPVDRVQDVTYEQRFLERLIGVGSLTIESAGDRGSDVIPDVAHPAVVQGIVNRARRAPKDRGVSGEDAQPPGAIAAQLATLEDLHRRGILTDAEFREKRAEYLDRL
jgi:uncharacterized membrane protein YdbT with pleckstrin-like domain